MQRAQAGGAVVSTVRYLYKQHNGGMYSTRERYGPVADRPIGRCEEMDGNAPSVSIKVFEQRCREDLQHTVWISMCVHVCSWLFLLDCHWIKLQVTAALLDIGTRLDQLTALNLVDPCSFWLLE